MPFAHAQYWPIALPFFLLLAAGLAALLLLIQIKVLTYAYSRLGMSSGVGLPAAARLADRKLHQYSDCGPRG